MLSSDCGSNMLVTTGRCVIAANVSGVTNSRAAGVMTTSTDASICTSLLARVDRLVAGDRSRDAEGNALAVQVAHFFDSTVFIS